MTISKLSVGGDVELYRREGLPDDSPDLDEFIGIIRGIAEGIPDCIFGCSGEAELGVSLDAPMKTPRIMPIGRLLSAAIPHDRLVCFAKVSDLNVPTGIATIHPETGVHSHDWTWEGDARFDGWFMGTVYNKCDAFLLFPRSSKALLAFICEQNAKCVKDGGVAKPVVLVHWDHDLVSHVTGTIFHGDGDVPDWYCNLRTDRKGVVDRILRFLNDPTAYFKLEGVAP